MKFPIKTKRLILRELQTADWKAVHEYAADKETTKFMTFGPNTPAQTKKFVQESIKSFTHQKGFVFAIILKKQKTLIGCCHININSNSKKYASIGYILNKNFWGNGYATEAASALLSFAFKNLKLHRVIGSARPKNKGSINILKKIGMRLEGHLIKNIFSKGKWQDSLQFAMLEEEFFHK